MIKFCAAALALMAAIPSSDAGTISYTAPIGTSWVGDPESINTSMPGFTASLGTLTGATYNVFGTGYKNIQCDCVSNRHQQHRHNDDNPRRILYRG